MNKPQIEIVRRGSAQHVYIDGYEIRSLLSFSVTSDQSMHPNAEITLTILGQIKELPNGEVDVTTLEDTSRKFERKKNVD